MAVRPDATLDDTDKKWLDALENTYPVIGACLPFFKRTDGTVDPERTLQNFLRLIGAKLGPDGRILEPYGE